MNSINALIDSLPASVVFELYNMGARAREAKLKEIMSRDIKKGFGIRKVKLDAPVKKAKKQEDPEAALVRAIVAGFVGKNASQNLAHLLRVTGKIEAPRAVELYNKCSSLAHGETLTAPYLYTVVSKHRAGNDNKPLFKSIGETGRGYWEAL